MCFENVAQRSSAAGPFTVWFDPKVRLMRKLSLIVFAAVVFCAGYLVGSSHSTNQTTVTAATQEEQRLSDQTLVTYRAAQLRFTELGDVLAAENRYRSVSNDHNYFAVSVGGIDAFRDLEEGRGVDPETFAALYAERSVPEIAQHVEFGDDGRLRYKGNIVRVYSRERLKSMFNRRDEINNRADGQSF